jgi:hypothetical protein
VLIVLLLEARFFFSSVWSKEMGSTKLLSPDCWIASRLRYLALLACSPPAYTCSLSLSEAPFSWRPKISCRAILLEGPIATSRESSSPAMSGESYKFLLLEARLALFSWFIRSASCSYELAISCMFWRLLPSLSLLE